MKTCNQCGLTKSLDQFYNHKRATDGKRPNCNTCRRAYKAGRRERLKNATAAWFEREAVAALYAESRARSTPHQVDHIIPVNGRLVCGLHCLANLQVIPAHENNRKNNTFEI